MNQVFETTRMVQFRDTDAAGIMHFSVFFTYMESVEHEFLRHLGSSVIEHDGSHTISWPRVRAECNYHNSVRFEELLEIQLAVGRIGNKSVTYRFEFSCDGRSVASGNMTSVCCRIEHGVAPQPIEIGAERRQRLEPFLLVGDE